jgi:hypothetical protein
MFSAFRFIALLACVPVLAPLAHADALRCTFSDGSTLYSDSPCPRGTVASRSIARLVDACATAECTNQRRLNEQAAWQRLQADKLESERYQERLLRAEELRLREMALAKEQLALAVLEHQARLQEYEMLATPLYAYPYFPAHFQHRFHPLPISHRGIGHARTFSRSRPMLQER